MGTEIERKFLVADDRWRDGAEGIHFRQGYLSTAEERNVRVRIRGDRALLTVKGRGEGLVRLEFEYEIPLADARQLLDELCERPLIEKVRYRVPFGGLTWEVDEFEGDNAGLIVAEVELEDEAQEIELPPWVGEEVSADPRYLNANLVRRPYGSW